jgi:hypothetical protein
MSKYQAKAQELFGKFAMYLRANLMYDEEANEDAKQCALIAVDELIANEHLEAGDASFWEPVKDELLKMK